MSRIMTIWLPRWPVQRRLCERPEWRKRPLFVCRREPRGLMTVVSWAWAEPPKRRRAAIQPGMPLAEAMAVLALAYGSPACHAAEIDPDDPAADREALEQLARSCRRFSPVVGIEGVPQLPGQARARMAAAAECLHLDVTGTAGFFGGEASLARTAVWTLAARGLHVRTAIADTPAAAWAAAHHTDLVAQAMPRNPGDSPACSVRLSGRFAGGSHQRWAVVPPGAQRLARGEGALLAGLPLTALRLEPTVMAMLREVGIDTLGGLLRLPAKSLASRFPASVSLRLAELAGTRGEPIMHPGNEELPQATHDFELPLSLASVDDATIASLLEQLVGRCVPSLAARGEGVVSLQVRLEPAMTTIQESKATTPPTVIDVGLFRPSISPRHLVELVRLRMSRMKLPREIEAITVEVITTGPAICRQRPLFDSGPDGTAGETAASQASEVSLLLDRLAGRLGRPAVFGPRPVADAQPEHAWIATPPAALPVATPTGTGRGLVPPSRQRKKMGGAGRNDHRSKKPSVFPPIGQGRPLAEKGSGGLFSPSIARRPIHADAGRRPIWMPPRPMPLEPLQAGMISVAPDGPPVRFRLGGVVHHIRVAHGPERIETAWWRGPTVRRDYYVVETESGARFWLFRRLGGKAVRGSRGSGWYLHGVFA
jgi:protein ImuB